LNKVLLAALCATLDSAVQAGEPMTAKVLTGRPARVARSAAQLNP
jgi:hypothetical protein